MSAETAMELVREGLLWSVQGLLPVVVVCVCAAVLYGLLAYRVGLVDTALPVIVRAAAVAVTLYALGALVADEAMALTGKTWGSLARVGQGALPVSGASAP